jgi:hypothetical protein
LVALSLVLAPGCTFERKPLVPKPQIELHPDYYKLEITIDRRGLLQTEPGDSSAPLSADAKAWLAPGRRVAVMPPTACVRKDAPTGELFARSECGVALQGMEQVLGALGYKVVSWQSLRAAMLAGESPREVAKALGVEVLFEINAFGGAKADASELYSVSVGFFAQRGPGIVTPLMVQRDKMEAACKRVIQEAIREAARREVGAALSVKAIHLKDERALWAFTSQRYEKQEGLGLMVDASRYFERRVQVIGAEEPPYEAAESLYKEAELMGTMAWASLGFLAVGGIGVGAGIAVDEEAPTAILITMGTIIGIVGFSLAMVTGAGYGAHDQLKNAHKFVDDWNSKPGPSIKEKPPEEVICVQRPDQPPWLVEAAILSDEEPAATVDRRRLERAMRQLNADLQGELGRFIR